MSHEGFGAGQLLGRVLNAHLGAAFDSIQDRALERRLLEFAGLGEQARAGQVRHRAQATVDGDVASALALNDQQGVVLPVRGQGADEHAGDP